MDILQYKSKYIDDASELLLGLDEALMQFEKDLQNTALLEKIMRVMHTLKGTSGMYGFDNIALLTHEMENIYARIRDNQIQANAAIIDVTFAASDIIRTLLQANDIQPYQQKYEAVLNKIQAIIQQPEQLPIQHTASSDLHTLSTTQGWRILFTPDASISERNINIIGTLNDLFKLGTCQVSLTDTDEGKAWDIILHTTCTKDDVEDALIFVQAYYTISPIQVQQQQTTTNNNTIINKYDTNDNDDAINEVEQRTEQLLSKTNTNRLWVDASKLDTLLYLVSELVTTKSELQLSLDHTAYEKISEATQKIDKLSKMFRDNALSIRLVSLRDMVSRFRRLVHDLAKILGKQIDFEVLGEETELDKSVVEIIAEPIMHIIRNCIDHGIETPENRAKLGKRTTGIIKFFAYKSGNFVFIQIADDGHGIDRNKVLQKAVEKGIIKPDAQLSNKEIYELIFLPGFSTAESLTQVSGRGVGMDVVRKKIQEIRGEINLDSEDGLGTSFTLKLQQTISIIDTLLVSSDGWRFAIPVEDIEHCQIIETHELQQSHNKQIDFKNELIPYISLHQEFEQNGTLPDKQKAVIINKYDKRYAIITHEIIGEYQAVVKPLGSTFAQSDFISGASVLGDGSIALLLDTDKLKRLIN